MLSALVQVGICPPALQEPPRCVAAPRLRPALSFHEPRAAGGAALRLASGVRSAATARRSVKTNSCSRSQSFPKENQYRIVSSVKIEIVAARERMQ